MASNMKNEATADPVVGAVAVAPVEPVTLEEFGIRLSRKDNRVELRGAFHSVEKAAGRIKDVESAYLARFDAFANKPV